VRATQTSLLERAPLGGPQLEVLDTNAIFNDLIYQLRHNREVGTLIRSAREGAVWLFATSRVLDEVRERAITQERRGFSVETLLGLFERHYLPEIRFVDVAGIPVWERALAVGQADPDDLPTAQLALLLAPCHVYTDDPHLTEAGFGEPRNWLSLTQSAERAMRVDQTMLLIAEVTKLAWGKVRPWIERNRRELGSGEILIGVGLGLAVLTLLPPAGHAKIEQAAAGGGRLLSGAGELTASAGLGLVGERARHSGYLAEATVEADETPTLEQSIARELALRGPLKVRELGVAVGVEGATVDALLRLRPCFVNDRDGWWLGRRMSSP
jgi:predicted nucleic acid-binding protein